MEVTTVLLRTLLVYLFLLVILRVMGKREIKELSVLDFVVSIMIAELAVTSIENVSIPVLESFAPITALAVIQILLAYLSLKSPKLRHIIDGKPTVLISNGKIDEKEMKKQRYNFDDLLMQIREKDVKDISDVEFAILEPSGDLSVFEKESNEEDQEYSYPVPLIIDGVVQNEQLQRVGKDELWLRRELRKAGIESTKAVSYCVMQENGILYIDMKDE
ncbi:Uncharacterized membrane protein YcaP, DUF421 family [Alteribacillus persepolensis]|uniref:Uncharacterized membrane protein YcaP, DUF421 family n=1 Tax=Alteribacillus persepolensis TaxID=568899 RepID=A0A1G8DHM2_9BACI|nr:DUF421 domain-containing protein [Alteribacillus persepolensis]SDH57175.1 Uncharacterized membrane protein YcaP, DUF421 family [Alteribacillus persepolensis]